MNCTDCNSLSKKHGRDRNGNQRFRCLACKKAFSEPNDKLLGSMYLPEDKAILCLQLLIEGNSVRSIERITGVHRDTVLSLLETVGRKCLWIQENLVRNVKVKFIEADEVWSFVGMKDKAKNAKLIEDEKIGTQYTLTCIHAESKLIVGWHLGHRTEQDALVFFEKVYNAIEGGTKQFQISTDGWTGYNHAVHEVLGMRGHYGQIVKMYGAPNPEDVRYSAAECVGCKKRKVFGNPM